MIDFKDVTIKMTRQGGQEITTKTMFDLSGFGSQREQKKKIAYDDTTFVSVGAKEYETLSFQLPYSETSGEFHAEAEAAYNANELVAFEIEFNNKKSDEGAGTKMSGNVKFTSYKPTNDDKSLVSNFTAEWNGKPTPTKAI